MFNIHKVETQWGGQTLTLETGRIARQADGAVLATLGETVVLCAVTAAKSVKEGQDFFPLTVHYQEKFSAAGRIPGGFFKREGRPTEHETLTSRLIDRPIRPLFPEGFYNEVNVICQVMSYDGENEPDVLALVAASAALTLSGVPFMGPIAGGRVGYVDGEYVLNPSRNLEGSKLDLVAAGTTDAVLMVESEAHELSEEVMLGAVMFVHENGKKVIDAIIRLAEKAAKDPWELKLDDDSAAKKATLKKLVGKDIEAAYKLTVKQERVAALDAARAKAKDSFADAEPAEKLKLGKLVKKLEADIVRGAILKDGRRIDGRGKEDVRPIMAEVQVLPRTHGSALFTRGETQAIVTTTLGTADDEQMIDAIYGISHENFLLHYNFPPYSVGEVGRFGAPGRREVGHGKLAWRALRPVLPTKEEFPYTMRVISDITESNGSSSMATVCGGSLALMDAGVPLKRPVSGIAMGLILEGKDFAVISDILGDEDHLGDMDFKVAGTELGITSLQMDIKVAGITEEIMKVALSQAKAGRAHILNEMNKALDGTRTEMSAHAPRIETMSIPKDKIREVIGTGGKVIREIVAETGAKVDIEDDGTIKIASSDLSKIEAAKNWIIGIVAEPEVGKVYNGKVVSMVDFGAFVNFMGAKDGLVHISEIKEERVAKVSDVLTEGQEVKVKVLGIDDRGKVRLSMRLVNQETGEELPDTRPPREERPRGERSDRGDRGDRGGRGGDRGRGGGGGRDRDRGPRRDRGEGGDRPRREESNEGEAGGLPDFIAGDRD
ncbi:polyribonucleotide nucleotidyltransferase [Sphingosinicella microcystinivorans]|uniref:Polyribonucleotide nucleotidyltransferase n=1 Tax=Sphingosinicella microcystinivorans TaxID=335406 RepID=A0AAD1D5S3_SPHMI|nr:polyribonucleotide nucleotidyltransferase [Sphingosinicella microcystinivorans]RKS90843.1 polyribonucleotide nucleotidyltransferase [Sphingosinicella microcystinivorans]BBE33759.1 polyribonucleotide nucleotidyltransferase [Sphingosinicella microcystinivorans]